MSDQPKDDLNEPLPSAHEKVSFGRGDHSLAGQFPSAQGVQGLKMPRGQRSIAGNIAKLIAFIAILLVGAVVLFAIVLSHGISNPKITNRLLEEASQRVGKDFSTTSETGVIKLVSGQLVFQFQGMELLKEGQPTARIDKINLGLDAKAMIARQIDVTNLTMDGISVLTTGDNTKLSVPKDPAALAVTIKENLQRGLQTLNQARLPRIEIRNVQIAPSISIPEITIDEIGPSEYLIAGNVQFFGQIMPLDGIAALKNGEAETQLSLKGLDLTKFTYKPGFECGGIVDASFRSQPIAQTYRSDVSINWQNGFCTHPKAGPVDIEASTKIGVRSDKDFFDVDQLILKAGESQFRFDGGFESGTFTANNGGQYDLRFEVISDMSEAHSEISEERPLSFAAKVAGFYRFADKNLDIESIGIRTPSGGEATGEALLSFAEKGPPALFAALTAKNMQVSEAKQLWPYFAARGARNWVHEAVFSGVVESANLEMTVPAGILGNGLPLGPDHIRGNADIKETRFDLVSELPAVRGASGLINFAGTNVTADLSEGTAYLGNDRQLQLENAQLSIQNAHIKPSIARVKAKVKGAMPALVDFANRQPINASEGFAISPSDVTGQGRADLDLKFSVNITGPKIAPIYDAVIDFDNLNIKKPIRGRSLSDLSGRISIKEQRAKIQMKGTVDGLRATFDIEEPIGTDNPNARKQDLVLSLNSRSIKQLSPELARYLSGNITAKLTSMDGRAEIDADLKDATIRFDAVGVRKPKGQSGRARFTLEQTGGTTRISNFRLDGKSLSANGSINIDENGLRTAKLTNVAFPGAKNFDISATREKSGLSLVISGDEYDARDLLKQYRNLDGGNDKSTTRLQLKANIQRVQGLEGQSLSSVNIVMQTRGGKENIDVAGLTVSGKKVKLIRNEIGKNRRLSVSSDDAGALLKFVGLYSKMKGGTLSADLNGIAGNAYQGAISLTDFEVRDEPKLKALVSGGGKQSLNSVTNNKLRSDRIKFRNASGNVLYSKSFLTVRDGLISGQEVGLTLDGVVYDESKNMNLKGTFLPAYGLNKVIGNIPILGQLLGKGEKSGLIGITFKLEGDFRDPRIFVNPLSLVAPGIFREIFRF